jgi:hypothetical protein
VAACAQVAGSSSYPPVAIRRWLEFVAECGHPGPRERFRIRAVDHQLKLSGHDHSQRLAFSSFSEPGLIGSTQNGRPPGSRITHQVCTFCTRSAPSRSSLATFLGVEIVGMNVQVDTRLAGLQALHEQHQVGPAEEGPVVFGGVDLWQLLPDRALPECQFPVVQVGRRVDDNLQHTAVVRHGGHGVTTKIIEGARDGDLASHRGNGSCRIRFRSAT